MEVIRLLCFAVSERKQKPEWNDFLQLQLSAFTNQNLEEKLIFANQ